MTSFVVVGAGAIGGFVGTLLLEAGLPVKFLVRDSERSRAQRAVLSQCGLIILCSADPDFRAVLSPQEVSRTFTTDEACLDECDVVLVATKRTANDAVHVQLIRRGVRRPVVFLQNGLRVCNGLEGGEYERVESVVHFNTVLDSEAGIITLAEPLKTAKLVLDGRGHSGHTVAALISQTVLETEAVQNFPNVQSGKLLLNMTNAVNALSGLTLLPMFMEPSYRLVLAASISEAQEVFRAAGMQPEAARAQDAFLLKWFVSLLRSPQWVFAATVGRKLKSRGEGRSSMAQDLAARQVPTEIDFLNGEVARLGRQLGVPTPVNDGLIALMKRAEEANQGCPGISGADLLEALGLPAAGGESGPAGAKAALGTLGVLALVAAVVWKARAKL